MALDRTPRRGIGGLVALGSFPRGSFPNEGIEFRLVTSEYVKDLLYSGPKASGIIAAVNEVHRDMAAEITSRAYGNYFDARAKRANKRRDARRWFKMEGELRAMIQQQGRGHPVFKSANGASGIRSGTGFAVDFTELDSLVTDPKGFPYWRSLEFGYGSFYAVKPVFFSGRRLASEGGSGRYSFPSGARASDPRMPQRVAFAPQETVRIRAFAGYGMFGDAIRTVSSGPYSFKAQGSPDYYPTKIERALPVAWRQALDLRRAGFGVGKVGGRKQLVFNPDNTRYRGPVGGRFTKFDPRF